jgi:hypothetical protein
MTKDTLNYRAIHGNEPPPDDKPIIVRCPEEKGLTEAYAVVRKKGVRFLLDVTGQELTRRADLWTEHRPILKPNSKELHKRAGD